MKKQKYIAPGSWFTLKYPANWHEFEDMEDCFLFYNPDKWTGNFRISAYRGTNKEYARKCMMDEKAHVKGAEWVKIGEWDCVYSMEKFQEKGVSYVSHIWVTGKDNLSVECSFTTIDGESAQEGKDVIATLHIPQMSELQQMREIIPIRVLEINVINESYDWAVSVIKKNLVKDFTSSEKDIKNLQKIVDGDYIQHADRKGWENIGIAFGSILENEIDGMEWVISINKTVEMPALRFRESDLIISPMNLIWDKKSAGVSCDLQSEYDRICAQVELILNGKA